MSVTKEDLINAYEEVQTMPVDTYTAEQYAGLALSCGLNRISTENAYGQPLDWRDDTQLKAAAILESLTE